MRLWVVRKGNVAGSGGEYLADQYAGRRLWCKHQGGAFLFRSRAAAKEAARESWAFGAIISRAVRLRPRLDPNEEK